MIRDDIALARALEAAVRRDPSLDAGPGGLSIATFRYLPPDLRGREDAEAYLNALNEEVVGRLQAGGEAFVSNAVVAGRYYLRACIVNFRTTRADVEALPAIVTRTGAAVDSARRPAELRPAGGEEG